MMLTQWNIPGVLGYSYRYDNYGENNTGRVTFADNLTNGASRDATLDRSWYYDHVGRLDVAYTGSEARATIGTDTWGHPDGPYAHDYNYDVWGNIASRVGWGGWNAQYTASFNNKNQMLTNPGNGLAFSYDAAGNTTYDGGQTFTYDALGKQVASSWEGLQQGYDGDGLRAKKVMNGVALYYLRSSVLGGQVVSEINASGTRTRGYVYLGLQLVAVQQNNAVTWVHQDPVTKGQRLVAANGALVSTIELDPFGGDTDRSQNSAFQPRNFTTYERDTVGGMDEAMARRYHGWWSRFSQPDPYDGSYLLTDPQSFNRYSYVQSDPVNFEDPSGLMPCVPGNYSAECNSSGFGGWGGWLPPSTGWGDDPRPGLREIAQDEIDLHPIASVFRDVRNDLYGFASLFSGYSLFISYLPQDPVPQPHPSPTPTPPNSQNQGGFGKCFNGWRFGAAASQPFAGTRFHGTAKGVATFLEIGPPISLGGDAAATAFKATRSGIGGTTNPYGSSLNFFFRHTADSTVKGSLIKFGTKATPILSGVGAFTAGYNASVAAQCGLGVIQ